MRNGHKAYKGARLARCVRGTVRETGEYAIVLLYEGRASGGFRTDYEQRPTRWLVIRQEKDGDSTFTYSGRNYDEGARQFDACAAEIEPARV